MRNHVNYVCWSSAVVTATIPTEAATPSDAMLLATHSPLRITRAAEVGDQESSRIVSEREVLDEFLMGAANNGVRVATVLGESGTGKSHLIRWVKANLGEDTPRRHVVYLKKSETSLRDVVEALLIRQEDPELEEIRRRVSSLGAGMTQDEMEQRLLAELAEVMRTAEPRTPLARALVGENGLSLFFLDPLFRRHLLRPGSFVQRRAAHALHGRAPDEPDVPLEFTVDELPLDIVEHADIRDAAAATQLLFRRLANPQLQAEAVRLLNDSLDLAVTRAASLNVGDLGRAFRKIREKLVGQEIILLIEDVALIQGVRRDLLEAIVESGTDQGKEKYATVRTMMAVTPGYYRENLPETFRYRAEASSPVCVVDVDLDSQSAQEQDLVDFVGRYLNAARVGKTKIEATPQDVPNGCTRCEFESSCHAAFGASRQGYGLYPYNEAAILRAVRACADRNGDRVVFNPRRVLSRAVRDALNNNVDTIRSGNFPPADFLAAEAAGMALPRLPSHVRERIETDYSAADAGRLETLVTFWGDAGTKPIGSGVLESFAHPPLPKGLLDREIDSADIAPDPNADKRGQVDIPNSVQKQLNDIEAWSQGQTLPQNLANDLRSILRDALLARLAWFDVVIKEPDASTLTKAIPNNARSFSIEGAIENLPIGGTPPLLRLERSAKNAMMFRGLIYIQAGLGRRAGDALSRLDATVAPKAEEAKQRILAEMAANDPQLARAAASLIRGAVACGVLPARPTELELVNAALWVPADGTRTDASGRSQEWLTAYERYVATRQQVVDRLMAGAGASQGTRGAVYAVDIQRLSKIVREARKLAGTDQDLDVPVWCAESDRRLKTLSRAGQLQLDFWQKLTVRIRAHMPAGVSLPETVDAVIDAVKAGQGHGLVKVPDLPALMQRNEVARSWKAGDVAAVERLLEDTQTQPGAVLQARIGAVVGADLPRIADYLESSAQWIEAGIRDAESSVDSIAGIDAQLEKTIERWFEILGEKNTDD